MSREYFLPYKVLTSSSTLLEICKVGFLGERVVRKEMKGFVSFHINLLYNIKINSFLYRNDKYFFIQLL